MKNLQLRSGKQIDQLITRVLVILVTFGLFGSIAYSQITATIPASRCGEGMLVLSATASSGNIKWYDVPFYGTPVGTGTTFTTPVLAVTQTYYVDAIDASGCSKNSGSARVQVIATISASSIQTIVFYSSNTFCKSVDGAQTITRTGTAGGSYTVSPLTGLTLDASTGSIIPGSSTTGTYTVTYTVTAAAGCTENPASTDVTITTIPVAPVISYTGSPYCTTAVPVSVIQTGAGGGIYSASPSGLTINTSTGTITPSSSSSGTYTITYFVPGAGGCNPQTTTTSVTITGLPTASISYSGTPYCKDIATAQTPTLTGTGSYTGGTYTASGLTIDASAGAITPSLSTAGTYTIYYTAPASGNCATVQVSTSVTINPLPTATISGTVSVCQDAVAPNITFTGDAGTAPYIFTYKINSGIDRFVTSASGTNPVAATVANSTISPGTFIYTLVNVTDAMGCTYSAAGGVTITVNPAQVAAFSYLGSPFCKTGSLAPTFTGGGVAGTFTKTAGAGSLSIVAGTGVIDLGASDAGSYTITNTLSVCGSAIATYDIVINALPAATLSGTLTACVSTLLSATTDATNKTYMWYKDDVVISGAADATYTVTESGAYKVKVTNTDTNCEYNSVASTVTIYPLPVVTISGNTMACVSSTLTANHNAANPSYIWYKAGTPISEATNSTLLVTESGSYSVKVTNGATTCNYTTADYSVTINPSPTASITGPETATVCVGASSPLVTFTGAVGQAPYTFTYNINSGTDQTVVTSSGSSVTVAVPTTDPGVFIYTLTKIKDASMTACEQAQTGTATVTVVALPIVLTQPVSTQSNCLSATPTDLTIAATGGTGSFSYQWYSNSSASISGSSLITGATNGTYTPPTTIAGTKYYYCIIAQDGNGCGTLTSNFAEVIVYSQFTSGAIATTGQTICYAGTPTEIGSTTNASGGHGTITYEWESSLTEDFASRTALSSNTATYTPADGLTLTTWYRRIAYDVTCNPAPTLSTGIWKVTVNALPTPTFTAQPGATALTATDVTYTTESGKSSYVWTFPGTVTTDYTITSGGGNTNSVTLQYVTTGSKTVTINYTDNGCTAASATSSTSTTVSTPLAIGDAYQGGRIAYFFQSGDPGYVSGETHGLIAALADIGAVWSTAIEQCYGSGDALTSCLSASIYTNADAVASRTAALAMGMGQANTTVIIARHNAGSVSKASYAAGICDDYTNVDSGTGVYSDWYLPSYNELNKLRINKLPIFNYNNGNIWSSSENSDNTAWTLRFDNSNDYAASKASDIYFRPVRNF